MKELFNNNTNLVYKVFHEKIKAKLENTSMEDDLIQIGLMALWKCCMKYDPERGVQFSTYAYTAIYKSMMCSVVREKRKTAYLVSLNKQVNSEAEKCPITYEDIIAAPVNVASQVEIDDIVRQIAKTLGKNSEKVVEMVREGHSQADIAKELDITRAYVCKILKKFRKKLKNTLFLED